MSESPLAAAFLARLDAGTGVELDVEELGARLVTLLARACQAWPGVEVAPQVFVEYVAVRLRDRALDDLHTDDLYLACACAAGDARALELFDAAGLAPLDGALYAAGASATTIADVKQILRERVLVAVDGHRGIEAFAGHGDLRGWLRVAALREVIQTQRKAAREVAIGANDSDNGTLLDRLVARDDLELAHLRRQCATELHDVFAKAMSSLTVRERNLLRLHFIDGLSIDDIGGIHDVHRSTAARWLVKAERLLQRRVRRDLKDRLAVDTVELAEIWQAIESQLEISITGLLRTR